MVRFYSHTTTEWKRNWKGNIATKQSLLFTSIIIIISNYQSSHRRRFFGSNTDHQPWARRIRPRFVRRQSLIGIENSVITLCNNYFFPRTTSSHFFHYMMTATLHSIVKSTKYHEVLICCIYHLKIQKNWEFSKIDWEIYSDLLFWIDLGCLKCFRSI